MGWLIQCPPPSVAVPALYGRSSVERQHSPGDHRCCALPISPIGALKVDSMTESQLAWGGANQLGSLALDMPRPCAEGIPVIRCAGSTLATTKAKRGP